MLFGKAIEKKTQVAGLTACSRRKYNIHFFSSFEDTLFPFLWRNRNYNYSASIFVIHQRII